MSKTDFSSLSERSIVLFIIRQLLICVCLDCILAEAIVTSGKTEKSPHDQEIKFFAKVSDYFMFIYVPLYRICKSIMLDCCSHNGNMYFPFVMINNQTVIKYFEISSKISQDICWVQIFQNTPIYLFLYEKEHKI